MPSAVLITWLKCSVLDGLADAGDLAAGVSLAISAAGASFPVLIRRPLDRRSRRRGHVVVVAVQLVDRLERRNVRIDPTHEYPP